MLKDPTCVLYVWNVKTSRISNMTFRVSWRSLRSGMSRHMAHGTFKLSSHSTGPQIQYNLLTKRLGVLGTLFFILVRQTYLETKHSSNLCWQRHLCWENFSSENSIFFGKKSQFCKNNKKLWTSPSYLSNSISSARGGGNRWCFYCLDYVPQTTGHRGRNSSKYYKKEIKWKSIWHTDWVTAFWDFFLVSMSL